MLQERTGWRENVTLCLSHSPPNRHSVLANFKAMFSTITILDRTVDWNPWPFELEAARLTTQLFSIYLNVYKYKDVEALFLQDWLYIFTWNCPYTTTLVSYTSKFAFALNKYPPTRPLLRYLVGSPNPTSLNLLFNRPILRHLVGSQNPTALNM